LRFVTKNEVIKQLEYKNGKFESKPN
jgi:hypothetical protein